MKVRLDKLHSTNYIVFLIITLLAFAVPLMIKDQYILIVLIFTLMYACGSAAWNILGGFAGQVSVGHSAYFGMGAYISTLLFMYWNVTPWIGMFVGAGASIIFAILIGAITFRLREVFYVMATLAFAEVLRVIFLNSEAVGGARGIALRILGDSPFMMQFSRYEPFYYVFLMMLLITILFTLKIKNSKFGFSLIAIRDNEEAAASSGVDVYRCKLKAAIISAFITSLLGTVFAQLTMYIEPWIVLSTAYSWGVVLPNILGGVGTILGPVVGACVLQPISMYLRATLVGYGEGIHLIFYSAVLILGILFMPEGLTGRCTKILRRRRVLRK